MNFFVTAIDTDSGKTLVSSILCEALGADYWKPVQAGPPHDSDIVRQLISNKQTYIHQEQYVLKMPASPHAAAKLEGVEIKLESLTIPSTQNSLVIEGAGGCLVPLNENEFVIDLAARFDCDVIIVSDLYLGSINHTLLTAREISNRQLRVKGIIFNGDPNAESERIILKHSGWKPLIHIQKEKEINSQVVRRYAEQLLNNW
jgi:dethiobiotin synthetase